VAVSERGSAPIELALGALVLLLPAALLVLSFGPLLERRNLARALAADAARTLVLTEGDRDAVVAFVERDAVAGGVDPRTVMLGMCGVPRPLAAAVQECRPDRSGMADVLVEILGQLEFVSGHAFTVSYRHREPWEPYRSRQ